MGIFEDLENEMRVLEVETMHAGYYYSVSNVLIILVCVMLCKLQTIDDIHEWSKSSPAMKFLQAEFEIVKIPCRDTMFLPLNQI